MNRVLYLITGLLFSCAVPAVGQQPDSLPGPRQQLWAGLELGYWLRNAGEGTYIVPEAALKYRFGRHGGLNFYTGYHTVQRDSLFGNIEYKNRGWYVKGGSELLLSVSANDDVYYTLGGNLAYSRFTEEALVSFRYNSDNFEAEIDPDNVFYLKSRDRSGAWTLEFQQGIWITEGPVSMLFSTRIGFLLNEPENPHMPVHYMPGIGTRTPQYNLIFRNKSGLTKDTFVSLRLYLFYRLF